MAWNKEGLRFGCTQCGKCCTGTPGYVWVNKREIAEMATFLKISPEEFVKKYTREVDGHLALLEDAKNYDCVFLKDGKTCTLYGSRPTQCRTYPWWPENVKSKEAWEEEGKRCEGINHPDAPLISFEEIKKGLNQNRE